MPVWYIYKKAKAVTKRGGIEGEVVGVTKSANVMQTIDSSEFGVFPVQEDDGDLSGKIVSQGAIRSATPAEQAQFTGHHEL